MGKSVKDKSRYVCESCNHVQIQWAGRCSQCLQWNSFREERDLIKSKMSSIKNPQQIPKSLAQIQTVKNERISSGIEEFNKVLGGGIVPGSVILIGGSPGVGKSTLLVELCGCLLYTSPSPRDRG